MKKTRNRQFLVHALAYCRDCDYEATYYTTAVQNGRNHARKTGHTVDIETGYSQTYNPK